MPGPVRGVRFGLCWLLSCAACDSAPPAANGPGGGVNQPGAGGSGVQLGPIGTGGVGPNASGIGGSGASGAQALPGAGSGAGMAGANAGGMAAAGSAGPAAGSGAMSDPLDVGNYFASGSWMGYVWTSANGAGSTITPTDFMSQPTGMPRCVKGTVAATADFSGTAALGVNLSEGNGVTSPAVTPTKAGVIVDVTNRGGSPLRFQIKSSASGGTEWCTELTGSGGFIPWERLRTKCWESTGVAYEREPIASAMVLVPGSNTAAVQFDFCLNRLEEADAPAGGTGGTAGTGTSGTGGAGSGGTGTSGTGGTGGGMVPTLQNGCDGYATRFWDCCKPHCGWSSNAPAGALASCDRNDNSLGGNFDAGNSCTGGPAHLCHSNTPWAANDELSYGYTAVAARAGSDICGKCYQLEFTGSSHNAGADPGSAALLGKTMIVQAINIGGDVSGGQFDLAIPGGGVGAFNACSSQWGASASQLGPNYGGFLAACKQEASASDHAALKACVMQRCKSVFEDKGLTELAAGCRWFVDWFEAADNPSVKYAEVACPNELMNKGIRRVGGGSNACLR